MGTLNMMLAGRARSDASSVAFRFQHADGTMDSVTFAELHERSAAVASLLRANGVHDGDRVVIATPPGLSYVSAFFGCLYAGAIAVPVYPPRGSRHDERLHAVIRDCAPRLALTSSTTLARASALDGPRWLAVEEAGGTQDAGRINDTGEVHPGDPDGVAFLQYTSGSTGTPKGVIVPHRAVLANVDLITGNFAITAGDVGLSWLPPYHDMGLIGGILAPIYAGIPCVLMAPTEFVRDPASWLRAITTSGATVTGGPDFAYRLCAQRLTEVQCADLDLSRWRLAFTGAEPVRASTLREFTNRFHRYGFAGNALHPCYGLAEATLIVSGKTAGEPARVDSMQSRTLVSSGAALTPLRIVDPDTARPCAEHTVGEVWLSGPSVARGYWGRDAETRQTFHARLAGDAAGPAGTDYLRTGDLGLVAGGELYLVGRIKDLIIIRGRNLYPDDLEEAVTASHPALAGQVAAAVPVPAIGSIAADGNGAAGADTAGAVTAGDATEALAVLVEVDRHIDTATAAAAISAARAAVVASSGVAPHLLALVRRAALPRTSSGKVRRSEAARRWLAGELPALSVSYAGERATYPSDAALAALGSPQDLRAWLRAAVAVLLGRDEAELSDGEPLVGLGMDSLTAARLAAAAERIGLDIPIDSVLTGASLADLADLAERGNLAGPDTRAERTEVARPVATPTGEVSPGQRGLWLFEQLVPGTSAYTMAAAVRLSSTVDSERLDVALRRLLARHPGLRASFAGAKPLLVTGPVPRRLLTLVDAVTPALLDSRLTGLCAQPFDLAAGSLVRAWLVAVRGGDPVLLLAAHHAVVDLWSMDVLLGQLEAAYDEAGDPQAPAPEEVTPPPVPRPREADRRWWRERLAAVNEPARLPADRPPAKVASHHGSVVRSRLSPDPAAGLARDCAATPFAVLLAAVAILVARLGERDEVILGVPVALRDERSSQAVGYLVNAVPVYVDLSGAQTVREAVVATRAALAGAVAHASVPFDELVAMTVHARIDILVVDDSASSPARRPGALVRAGVPVDRGAAAVDLSILASGLAAAAHAAVGDRAGDAGIEIAWEYATDRFDGASVARLARRLDTVITGMAASPGARWRGLAVLDPVELDLVRRWSSPPAPAGLPGGDVAGTVWWYARHRPRTPAVVELAREDADWIEKSVLTYAQLAVAAGRVGELLARRGVLPGDRVGLRCRRGPALVAAMLGAWHAGAAYVPVDPAYPAQRNEAVLADAGVRVVLDDTDLDGLLDTSMAGHGGNPPPLAPLPREVDPAAAAYLIYTSGSTGTPKGVVVDQANLASSTAARLACYPEPVGRFLLLSSPAFDSSVAGIYWTLCTGGTLLLPPERTEADPVAAWTALRSGRATHTLTLPSLHAAMCEAAPVLGAAPDLRIVVVAGEECRADMVAGHLAAAPNAALVNEYGPTEVTVWATAHHLDLARPSTVVPIGPPVPGVVAQVRDRHDQPAGIGVPGELYLGGAQVARGYHERPDQTAERFVPDRGGQRLYRTGDRVSWGIDATLHFHGRIDDQVKVRGHRVEPAEIEAVLASHPQVGACAVTTWPGAGGAPRLVAYVVARTDTDDDVLGWLRQRLPPAAVPSTVVKLAGLPRRPNGKVDRRALPPPPLAQGSTGGMAESPAESTVADVFAQVLATPAVGAEDDFFDLGGHSLAAAQVAARLTGRLRTPVDVRDVFAAPTARRLAALLSSRGTATPAGRALPPITRQPRLATSAATVGRPTTADSAVDSDGNGA